MCFSVYPIYGFPRAVLCSVAIIVCPLLQTAHKGPIPYIFPQQKKHIFCRYSFLCFFTPHKVIGMVAVTVLLVKSNKYIKDQESCHAWLPPDVSITIITTISVYLTSQTPIIVNGLISLSFQFYNNLLIIPHSSAYPHHHTQDFNVISLYHI